MASWLTSLTAQAESLGQNFREGVQKLAHDLEHLDLSGVTQTVANAEHDILAEQQRIESEDAAKALREVKILPWETTDEAKSILTHDVMEKVLALSLERSNFTTPPPASTEYVFSLDQHASVAMRVLEADPNLSKMHAKLIGSCKEDVFWRNYFFRVEQARAEAGLERLCVGAWNGANAAAATARADSEGTPSLTDSYEKVTLSDARGASSGGDAGATSGGGFGGGSGGGTAAVKAARGEADDAALEAAVAAELGEDGVGDDFDDLGDLDDDVGTGGGAGDDDVDAELEAQIARELEES